MRASIRQRRCAMMAGATIGGAAQTRRLMLVDGLIATATALVAARIALAALEYFVFSHRSAEHGIRWFSTRWESTRCSIWVFASVKERRGACLASRGA